MWVRPLSAGLAEADYRDPIPAMAVQRLIILRPTRYQLTAISLRLSSSGLGAIQSRDLYLHKLLLKAIDFCVLEWQSFALAAAARSTALARVHRSVTPLIYRLRVLVASAQHNRQL